MPVCLSLNKENQIIDKRHCSANVIVDEQVILFRTATGEKLARFLPLCFACMEMFARKACKPLDEKALILYTNFVCEY